MKTYSRVKLEDNAILVALIVAATVAAIDGWLLQSSISYLLHKDPANYLIPLNAAFAAVVGFGVGQYFSSREVVKKRILTKLRRWMTMLALIIAHMAIAFLLFSAALAVFNLILPSAEIGYTEVVLLAALISAVSAYICYLQAVNMRTSRLIGVFLVFIFSGALASILNTSDGYWLQHHFSALGRGNSLPSYAFNLTMVIGGLLAAGLADYMASDLIKLQKMNHHYQKIRIAIVRTFFISIGFTMIGVGLFPVDTQRTIHDIFGHSMAILFTSLIVASPWLMPMFSRVFIAVSYAIVAGSVYAYWLFIDGYQIGLLYSEVVALVLFFIWLLLFIRQIDINYQDELDFANRHGRRMPINSIKANTNSLHLD